MNPTPTLVTPPAHSRIVALLPGAHFHDAWAIAAVQPELTALGQFLRAARATPRWVDACMNLRNRAVGLVGLKNLGGLASLSLDKPESAYRPGDRVGIFTLFETHPEEVLLGDRDKHLDVTLSVHIARDPASWRAVVTLTTVVQVHNLLGRIYMLPVTPMHRIIAPAVLRTVGIAE